MIFLLFSLLFTPVTGQMTRLYCFDQVNLSQVKSHIAPILKSTDTVNVINNRCLELVISQNRVRLFDSWIGKKFRYTNDNFKATTQVNAIQNEHCTLELTRRKKSQKSTLNLGQLKGKKTVSYLESPQRITVLVGKKATIKVNQEATTLTCYRPKKDRFEILIELNHNDVILSQQVSVIKGKEVILSDIVNSMKSESVEVSQKKLTMEKEKYKSKETVALKVY